MMLVVPGVDAHAALTLIDRSARSAWWCSAAAGTVPSPVCSARQYLLRRTACMAAAVHDS
jgi:hypothetical protein